MQPAALLAAFLSTTFLSTAAVAQLAAYRIVGSSCTTGRITSSIGPVPISVQGVPKIGSSFTVSTEGSANYPWGNRRRVFILTGLSNKSAGGLPLPYDVSKLFPSNQPFCGILRTSMELRSVVPLVMDYRTSAGVTFPVPNLASLAGLKFYQQVMSTENSSFGPPFSSAALSAGGEGTIGF